MTPIYFSQIIVPQILKYLNSPQAYIDPSTGGMLFQMLAVIFALFSGILFFFSRQIKTYFARIRRMIRGESELNTEDVLETDDDGLESED